MQQTDSDNPTAAPYFANMTEQLLWMRVPGSTIYVMGESDSGMQMSLHRDGAIEVLVIQADADGNTLSATAILPASEVAIFQQCPSYTVGAEKNGPGKNGAEKNGPEKNEAGESMHHNPFPSFEEAIKSAGPDILEAVHPDHLDDPEPTDYANGGLDALRAVYLPHIGRDAARNMILSAIRASC